MNKDTCVALATATGQAGLSVLRLSGKEACEIANKIFRKGPMPTFCANERGEGAFLLNEKEKNPWKVADLKGYQAKFGYVFHPQSFEILDQVVLLRFKAPHSYTGEDVVELSLHGGTVMSKRVLEACLLAGARLAEPGEFTKRAFLNGKLDLAQAEAVIDLIHSSSEKASHLALRQLQGSLSKRIEALKAPLLEMTAKLELALQYPEHEDSIIEKAEIERALQKTHQEILQFLSSYARARVIKEGYSLALSGLPNAGKSSLLNWLTGKETAIVTDIAGTTRDTLEAPVYLGQQLVHFIDTAGLTETEDVVEKIGIQKAKKAVQEAHLVCWLASVQQEPAQVWEDLQKNLLAEVPVLDKLIVLGTKADLSTEEQTKLWQEKMQKYLQGPSVFVLSSLEQKGLEPFVAYVEKICQEMLDPQGEAHLLTTERHFEILREMQRLVERLLKDIHYLSFDLLSLGLQESMELLSQITGESVDEAVMREIFTKFCVGK